MTLLILGAPENRKSYIQFPTFMRLQVQLTSMELAMRLQVQLTSMEPAGYLNFINKVQKVACIF